MSRWISYTPIGTISEKDDFPVLLAGYMKYRGEKEITEFIERLRERKEARLCRSSSPHLCATS